MTSINKDEVTEELQKIVTEFNANFGLWMHNHGCRAEFAWKYGTDRTQIKALEIQAVDLIVYRKPVPSFSTIKDAVNQAP